MQENASTATEPATLWDRIVAHLAAEAELGLIPLPEGLRLRDTAQHRFAFNYLSTPQQWNGQEIAPAGVAWWPTTPPKPYPDPLSQ